MKWYTAIMSFLTGFLNLTPGSEEQDIHEELSSVFGKHATLADYRKAVKAEIRTELETELAAAQAALQTQLDTANASLAAAQATSTAQAAQIETLTTQVANLNAENATLKQEPAAGRSAGARAEEGKDEKKLQSPVTARAAEKIKNTKSLPFGEDFSIKKN